MYQTVTRLFFGPKLFANFQRVLALVCECLEMPRCHSRSKYDEASAACPLSGPGVPCMKRHSFSCRARRDQLKRIQGAALEEISARFKRPRPGSGLVSGTKLETSSSCTHPARERLRVDLSFEAKVLKSFQVVEFFGRPWLSYVCQI